MNLKLFNELWERGRPSQHLPEWQRFLELCELYLRKHDIKNPIVVELGIYNNRQKKFYEQLLRAEHIGIDASTKRSIPDIHGNTHDFETLNTLRKKLNGRLINILFIDGSHAYEAVKKDFEMYSPLCGDIIALHDIENNRKNREVWKFWDELKECEDFLTLSIHQHRPSKKQMGIGMIIKE